MGLAASQARLLTITARKSDCEFQSMSLSHQKIALSRDMEKISDEYQAAMNKTKLVYDFYGTGTSQMNLNYSLLMTPSVYNDYFPKLLTDKQNRVVLAPEYAAAAKAAGIPYEGYNGTPSSEVRNAFVEALRDNNIITAATAVNIESIPYNNVVGLGSLYTTQTATMEITYADLLEMIKANCQDTSDYGLKLADNFSGRKAESFVGPEQLLTCNADGEGWGVHLRLYDNNNLTTDYHGNTGSGNVSLYDLLTTSTQYVYSCGEACGASIPICSTAYLQQMLVGDDYSTSFLNWMVEQFQSILGGVSQNDLALEYAYNQVVDLLYQDQQIQDLASQILNNNPSYQTGNRHDREGGSNGEDNEGFRHIMDTTATQLVWHQGENTLDEVTGLASNYVGMVLSYNGDAGSGHQYHHVAVNLNNIVSVFLTAFHEYMEGANNSNYSYEMGQTIKPSNNQASLWKPKNDEVFTIVAPTSVNDGTEDLNASFYDSMFNLICANGWTENENINNAEYMQELLKNGSVYISSIDNDAYYYQASYSTDTYISEIADTEAIAQAEAKYNAQKARIENKENTIDMKMKNLDTEISALTTEYDTMKNVINKSIEKSFKRYDA